MREEEDDEARASPTRVRLTPGPSPLTKKPEALEDAHHNPRLRRRRASPRKAFAGRRVDRAGFLSQENFPRPGFPRKAREDGHQTIQERDEDMRKLCIRAEMYKIRKQ